MKAVITVIGEDQTGIIAKTSALLYEAGVNIVDINQTIMQDIFSMIMLVDISKSSLDFTQLSIKLEEISNEMGVSIRAQREDIFNAMHRI